MSQQFPILAYGKNRPAQHEPSPYGYTDSKQDVWVHGYVMYGDDYSPYIIEGDDSIIATLLHIKTEDYRIVLSCSDSGEGFHSEGNSFNMNDRKLVTVETEDGPVQAWLYVASTKTREQYMSGMTVLESGDWLRHLTEKKDAEFRAEMALSRW